MSDKPKLPNEKWWFAGRCAAAVVLYAVMVGPVIWLTFNWPTAPALVVQGSMVLAFIKLDKLLSALSHRRFHLREHKAEKETAIPPAGVHLLGPEGERQDIPGDKVTLNGWDDRDKTFTWVVELPGNALVPLTMGSIEVKFDHMPIDASVIVTAGGMPMPGIIYHPDRKESVG